MPRAPTSLLVDAGGAVQITAQHPCTMSESRSTHDLQRPCGPPPHRRTHEPFLAGLILVALIRTGDASASDQVTLQGDALVPDLAGLRHRTPIAASVIEIPANFQVFDLPPEAKTFPVGEFTPRGRSMSAKESRVSAFEDVPMIRGTTVWQRLAEYRAHGRVRLLTLWEAGGSSVSLQAGRKGDPSLQWTSRLTSHGGATHGLLDHIFAASLAGASRGLHFSARAPSDEPAAKTKAREFGAAAYPSGR